MVAVDRNPIDAIWRDRPAPPGGAALPHPLRFAGEASEAKRNSIAAALRAAGQQSAVLTDPASIAWLFNIRGNDVAFTPFALGFALAHADGRAELFMQPEKLPEETRAWLGNAVTTLPRAALAGVLGELKGQRVRVDPANSPVWFAETLRAAGATVAAGPDPCLLPKACKNEVEQNGARAAHRRDAIAMCRFLAELADVGAAGRTTEMSAAARLVALRAAAPEFRGESFPAISGAGEHGAIMHYRVSPESDRGLRRDELYLIDSGGQYPDGTTDITRTLWTGPGSRRRSCATATRGYCRAISPSPR